MDIPFILRQVDKNVHLRARNRRQRSERTTRK